MAKEPDGNGKIPAKEPDARGEQLLPQAIFFNHLVVRHSGEEFYFDIGQIIPGTQLVGVGHRFVTTVTHAKRIRDALAQNIKRYEARFGRIAQPRQRETRKNKKRTAGDGN